MSGSHAASFFLASIATMMVIACGGADSANPSDAGTTTSTAPTSSSSDTTSPVYASDAPDAAPAPTSTTTNPDPAPDGGTPPGTTPLPTAFTKRLLNLTTYPNAVCNDGSPAGYYPVAGAAAAKDWVIFLDGGSWCSTNADCAGRSSDLSSSTGWASTVTPTGVISGDATQNPHFASFNRVYVPYCTSDVFSGDAPATTTMKFQFRGRTVMSAILADLRATYGLGASGSSLLLVGASAGGVSVLVTADRVAAALPGVKVTALVDAGFLPDVAPLVGPSIVTQFQTAMTNWNGVPDDSCAAKNVGAAYKCYLGQYAQPEITTSLFFGQNLEDPHGPLHSGGFTWPAAPTTAQINWMNNVYTPAVISLLGAMPATVGNFSPCQVVHTMVDNNDWSQTTVTTTHYDDAVSAFFNGTSVDKLSSVPCSFK